MALTRKFLSALGLEGDKVDEIIAAHSETVEALKEERDNAKREATTYKAEADKLPGVQKELEALKEAAEKDGGNAWKTKYDELKAERDKIQTEYDAYKNDIKAKEIEQKKDKAYRSLLKDTGVSEKRIDAVMKVTDLSKVELDDDGKVKDSDKHTTAIKEEWADFIATTGEQGAKVSTPPANNGNDGRAKSRAAELVAKYRNEHYGNSMKED